MKGKDVKIGMKVYDHANSRWMTPSPYYIAAKPGEYAQSGWRSGSTLVKGNFPKTTVAVAKEKGGKIVAVMSLATLMPESEYKRREQTKKEANERRRKEREIQDKLRDEAKELLMKLGFTEFQIGFTGTRVTIHCDVVKEVLSGRSANSG